MKLYIAISALWLGTAAEGARSAEPPPGAPPASTPVDTVHVAVLTAPQVLQILDQTVDWYRTLGTQQQSSSQPSDLLMYYANQQTAMQVVDLAFDLARANAELLSSEASADIQNTGSQAQADAASTTKTLGGQRASIQAELDLAKARARTASGSDKSELQAKQAELQGELDMVDARLNLLEMMTTFVNQSNSRTASAEALKAHIDAVAASVPGLASTVTPTPAPSAPAATPTTSSKAAAASLVANGGTVSSASRVGLWGLVSDVIALAGKGNMILGIDHATAALQQMFATIRSAPMQRLESMSRQSETLARQADSAHGADLKNVRNQLDTLAWLFQQTSAMLVPLIKEGVLLEQYGRNLNSWHQAVERQYHEALKALLVRALVVVGVLLLVLAGGELWRRMVLRYTLELRRRQQLLLIRKLTVGAVLLIIIGLTCFTDFGSFATFAGLITAGVAVAMQSVLTCIVGYFLLIGKYGLRVGDRVQIGSVAGEIMDLGMIRLHLMEFGSDGRLGATGRVVAFPNSIVFQATGGLFRQMPGVSLVWHEVIVTLPSGRDYATFKSQLLPLLESALRDYREAVQQQSRQIEQSTSSSVPTAEPQVQLRLTASGAEVVVRYPVQLERAAETDEKVTQAVSALLNARIP